ncbi:hypothetical protein BDN70DRAFT_882606 [Pholiota conissans]|uniref:Uncharacterized protein n=1 Tax=Pholiota conissans TaxID=109636 RepID=A0A9P6CXH2_9AGAR|nr:hypothetical protein BDN70DRAFT_882606 [Pholiota conissans]
MLFILILFSLFRSLRGSPLEPFADPADFPSLDSRDTNIHFGQRGVSDIITSCFTTILACTWSALHLDVPLNNSNWFQQFWYRVRCSLSILFAPEVTVAIALWQRHRAKEIAQEYNDFIASKNKKSETESTSDPEASTNLMETETTAPQSVPHWTSTHGFFVLMGGFVLCENGKPSRILRMKSKALEIFDFDDMMEGDESALRYCDLMKLLQNEIIDPPKFISKEDILDRSKSDDISKAFVVIQTTYFIFQCITRWAYGLDVTELEVFTLGSALINGFTYWVWWNKPQGVGRPIFLEAKGPLREEEEEAPENSDSVSDANSDLNHPLRTMIMALLKADEIRSSAKIIVVCGLAFALVHLIPGWFLIFPSGAEKWLWRVSAIILMVEPFLVSICLSLLFFELYYGARIFFVATVLFFPFYLYGSRILLILSLISLRSLPDGAFQSIEWTTYIPHF